MNLVTEISGDKQPRHRTSSKHRAGWGNRVGSMISRFEWKEDWYALSSRGIVLSWAFGTE
jgi:hypothetical protein